MNESRLDYSTFKKNVAGRKRLNFLLIIPRLVQVVGEGYQFPLGIAYIAASLKKAGFAVYTLNLNHREGDVSAILRGAIQDHAIDAVGTGGISVQYNTIYDIVRFTKDVNPRITTIVGGGLISAEPNIAMDALEFADYGVIGEGEITICELAYALECGADPRDVCGLIYRFQGQYITTGPRKEIRDVDSIPWPDYEGFELDRYLALPPPDVNNLGERRLVFLLGSRACPYNCTFCFHTVGRKYRKRSIASIIEELRYLVNRYHIEFVFMADELFGHEKERVREFCEHMKELNLSWRGAFRVDDIDEEMVQLLKDGNCRIIGLGLESADNKILKSMRKHITVEQIDKALKIIYDAKVPFSGNFIFGDIAETVETATNTFNWWLAHPHYNINLWMVVSYPGSYLYKYACENNIVTDRVKYLKEGCPAVNVSKLNKAEMSWLVHNLLEMPFKMAKNLQDIAVIGTNQKTNRMSISGRCANCGHFDVWNDIKPFISVSLNCAKCSQKHNTPFPVELQERVVKRVERLLGRYETIAVWGITFHSVSLFRDIPVFRNPGIIPIDNASSKQMMDLYGKDICAPSALGEKHIPAVIVFYPNSLQQISAQIETLYPSVQEVIDVCDLIHDVSRDEIKRDLPSEC